ncbi:MAG: S-layer homology domain-containing protein [Richelia sp. SM2_1_7]|nr:S-layer homology domain-containing protein [Richelia sp. SM2_1_7]
MIKNTQSVLFIIIIIPVLISFLANLIPTKAESAQLSLKILNQSNSDILPHINHQEKVNAFRYYPLLISQAKINNYQSNRVKSITEVRDISKKDDYYLALKELTQKYQVVRLYSDGSFRGKQAITGYEAIDLMGGFLKSMSEKTQKVCGFSKPPEVQIPKDIDRNSFYYDSYKELGKFSPDRKRFYGNENTLTRGGFVVMFNNYLLKPLQDFIAQKMQLIKTKELIYKTPSIPKNTQSILLSQVTSVSQISDVHPSDFFFRDLQEVVEKYGCIAGYSDGTFRPNQKITRGDFIVSLYYCATRTEELIATATGESSSCANNLQKKIAKPKFVPQVINKQSNSKNL